MVVPIISFPSVLRFSPLLLSGSVAIWLLRENRANGAGSVEPVRALEGLLKTRLTVEHSYRQMMNNMLFFLSAHGQLGVFCSLWGYG